MSEASAGGACSEDPHAAIAIPTIVARPASAAFIRLPTPLAFIIRSPGLPVVFILSPPQYFRDRPPRRVPPAGRSRDIHPAWPGIMYTPNDTLVTFAVVCVSEM